MVGEVVIIHSIPRRDPKAPCLTSYLVTNRLLETHRQGFRE